MKKLYTVWVENHQVVAAGKKEFTLEEAEKVAKSVRKSAVAKGKVVEIRSVN